MYTVRVASAILVLKALHDSYPDAVQAVYASLPQTQQFNRATGTTMNTNKPSTLPTMSARPSPMVRNKDDTPFGGLTSRMHETSILESAKHEGGIAGRTFKERPKVNGNKGHTATIRENPDASNFTLGGLHIHDRGRVMSKAEVN